MPKKKTEFEIAAGKLILAIQKEWGKELGTPEAKISEKIMYSAHDILQARTIDAAKKILGSHSLKNHLNEEWIKNHPMTLPAITHLEKLLRI